MNTIPPPIRYARSRYSERWYDTDQVALVTDPGGDTRLLRLPSVRASAGHPPGTPGASGLALDDNCGLYVADTTGSRIVRIGLDCPTTSELPGRQTHCTASMIVGPTGLAIGAHGWLYAATSDGHILVFSTPQMSMRDMWSGFASPVAVACHDDAVIVVDRGTGRVTRYSATGLPDAAFNAALAAPGGPADPRAVAIDDGGTIYIADAASGSVLRYNWSGAPAGPAIATPTQPTALAVGGGVLYVGDAASGHVLCYAVPGGDALGPVLGYDDPVTALAVGDGDLLIKPGLDRAYVVAALDSAYASSGRLMTGPLDAGLDSVWTRASADAIVPDRTSVSLDWYLDAIPNPAIIDWNRAPATDVMLPGGRFLWLRVTAATADATVSPTLTQLQARTGGAEYLDHLPLVYRQDPDQPGLTEALLDTLDPLAFPTGDLAYLQAMYARTPPQGPFLPRLLELVRSQLGDLEMVVGDLPALFDPATAPAASLGWLASWLGFELPPRLRDGEHPDEVRQLLLQLFDRYRWRGTPRGVSDMVELFAGVRPRIFEEYRARPLWLLGDVPLGFGTGLPDRDLEGVLVGSSVVGETGPEDPDTLGAAVFASTAHRFDVIVPPHCGLDDGTRRLITSVVAAERPAHTAFHVCFTEPRMRVGLQARVGVDAIVARGPDPMALGDVAILGLDSRLADAPPESIGAVGSGRLGIDTRTG